MIKGLIWCYFMYKLVNFEHIHVSVFHVRSYQNRLDPKTSSQQKLNKLF